MEELSNNSRRGFLRASTMLGLGAIFGPGLIGNAFANPQLTANPSQPNGMATIRPFHVKFSEQELADLRSRIRSVRWPEQELVSDASQGVQLNTMQKVAQYWAEEYDWRKVEARLNALP